MSTASPSNVTIRPPKTPAEVEAAFCFAHRAFAPDATLEQVLSWQRWVETEPSYRCEQVRCAFHDDRVVATCMAYSRVMRMGRARLPVACIGAVATDADYRRQGIASALMCDAIAYARGRKDALLLLDGIPGFYRRFGYANVFDPVWHAIEQKEALALEPSPYTVRRVEPGDYPALLGLYERHHSTRPGGFVRALERWERDLAITPPDRRPPVVVDASGRLRGYLTFDWEHHGSRASEVVAEDWPAVVALLQWHARMLDGEPEPPDRLQWPLPEDGVTFQLLADRLTLKTHAVRRPYAGWQARPAFAPVLLAALLPLWGDRWGRTAVPYTGLLGIRIEGDEGASLVLRLERGRLRQAEGEPAEWLALSADAFTQLICGYRTLEWILARRGETFSEGVLAALRVLFPHEPIWIPGSDSF